MVRPEIGTTRSSGPKRPYQRVMRGGNMTGTGLTNVDSTAGDAAPSWTHLRLERRSARYWRLTFDHPPINTITATTVTELSELVDLIEADTELKVVVFDSANPDFFLAHYDTENDPA